MMAPKFGRDEDVVREEEDFENGKERKKKVEACVSKRTACLQSCNLIDVSLRIRC